MSFNGQVAVVTGGSSGMGRISALRLADGGAAAVCIVDVDEQGLEETAAGRSNVHPYVCDVSDGDAVAAMYADVVNAHGPVDRLTHAAAVMPASPMRHQTAGQMTRLMRINYDGTVNMVMGVFGSMLERGSGDIIMYGSLAGYVLAPHLGAYCASKSAVNTFGEVLIQENRGCGVRMLLVCPPLTNTPLINQATGTSNPGSIQVGIEQGRMADPNDIVDAVEKALSKNKEILFPGGEAKALYRLRRFVPGLLWRIIWAAENSKKAAVPMNAKA